MFGLLSFLGVSNVFATSTENESHESDLRELDERIESSNKLKVSDGKNQLELDTEAETSKIPSKQLKVNTISKNNIFSTTESSEYKTTISAKVSHEDLASISSTSGSIPTQKSQDGATIYSTVYWSQVNIDGQPHFQVDSVSSRWELSSSFLTLSGEKLVIAQSGASRLGGTYLNQKETIYYNQSTNVNVNASYDWDPVIDSTNGVVGAKDSANISHVNGSGSWNVELQNYKIFNFPSGI